VIASYTHTPTPNGDDHPNGDDRVYGYAFPFDYTNAPTATPPPAGSSFFPADHNIDVVNVDGSGFKTLLVGSDENNCYQPMWSPDGTKILLTANFTNPESLYTVSADGSNLQRLIKDTTDNAGGVWSPDGKSIIFANQHLVNSARLPGDPYLVGVDGKGLRAITKFQNSNTATYPAFSPDGKQIENDLLLINANAQSQGAEIDMIGLDGTGQHKVISGLVHGGVAGVTMDRICWHRIIKIST
jgi:hypothetical protein